MMQIRHAFIAALAALLAGCGASSVQEVRDWMEAEKKQTPVKVKPLSPPKQYTPFPYVAQDEPDPFNASKLLVELERGQSSDVGAPDLKRQREPLESYPLDTMRMVGTIRKPGVHYALIQIDKAIHQVKAGSYIGQNFGRVVAIKDTAIDISETVQDAAGDWVERQTRLELQENKQ